MIRAAILGATGYTALELIKLLLRHPQVQITVLTSRQSDEPHVAQVHPQLAGRLDLRLQNLDPQAVTEQADCVFSCLPHAASAEIVAQVANGRTKVIDFSADYRLDDVDSYVQWYGGTHPDPQRVGHVPYGLPELFADRIAEADVVANPGCYPTSAILALAPLLQAEMIEPANIIIDSKSGVSGAGRTPKLTTLFPECNESLAAYAVGTHRHTPEIEQILGRTGRQQVQVIFTPHLVPMDRGILTTAYVQPKKSCTEAQVLDVLRQFYDGQPFVRVVDHLPATKYVSGTNYCDITARVVRDRIILISCLDNLVKGASGAAVQNMNLIFGLPQTVALADQWPSHAFSEK